MIFLTGVTEPVCQFLVQKVKGQG